jgi:AsmA-like C-terminal region
MTKSSPLLLLVATLCLVITLLAAFWIGLMPQRLLAKFASQLKAEQGIVLDAKSSSLGFDGGPVVTLQAVSLAHDGGFEMTARDVKIELGYAALFGGQPAATQFDFGAPVITLDVAKPLAPRAGFAPEILLHDATIKLKDSRNASAIALSEVNGKLMVADGIQLDLSFVQNGNLTTLRTDIDSADRFIGEGSPADITMASREKILTFAGRAKFSKGLELDGKMTLEGAEAQTLASWLGLSLESLRGVGEFKLTSGLSTQGLKGNFPDIIAQIGGHDLAGTASIEAGVDRLQLKADLSLPTLNLLPNTNVLASPWSELPLATSDLSKVNAELKLNIENLILRQHSWGPTNLSLNLKADTLDFTVKSKETLLNVKATPARPTLTIDLNLQSKAADAKTLLGGLWGFEMATGPLELSMQATANGNTPAALISTLKGKMSVGAGKLKLATTDMTAQFTSPGEGWKSGSTDLGITLDADISEGIAKLNKADLALPAGTIKLSGEIDALRQAFDLRVTPKGKVKSVKGTWTKPFFAAEAGTAPELRPVSSPAN